MWPLVSRRFLALAVVQLLQVSSARRTALEKRTGSKEPAQTKVPKQLISRASATAEHDLVRQALMGYWDTDYFPTVAFGTAMSPTIVDVTAMSGAEIEKFMHGSRPDQLFFFAESPKFAGTQGSAGRRQLKITRLFPYEGLNQPVAILEQRLDFWHPVRHVGTLIPTEEGWLIEWDHKRRWTRKIKQEGTNEHSQTNANDKHDENGQEAQEIGVAYMEEWDTMCKASSRGNVAFSAFLAVGASAGWSIFEGTSGVSASVKVMFGFNAHTVQSYQAYLQCILKRVEYFVEEKSETPEEKERNIGHLQRIVQEITKLLTPHGQDVYCYPGLFLTFSFSILAHPPFLWPIPMISISLGWPLELREILKCGKFTNATHFLQQAFASRPAEHDSSLQNMTKEAEQAVNTKFVYSQGPSLTIFPFSDITSYYGWSAFADMAVTINLRKLVHHWRKSHSALRAKPPLTSCEINRADYFRAAIDWSKSAHQMMALPSCQLVRDRLKLLQRAHPEIDMVRDPFSVVPHLRQLSDARYQQEETTSVSFGGAYIYIGTTVATGYYYPLFSTVANTKQIYHHAQCKPFEDFVNIYQQRIVHIRQDLYDIDRDEECEVGKLPPLEPASCSHANNGAGDSWKGFFMIPPTDPELASFPIVWVNPDNHSQILMMSDSHCTRCLSTKAYGDHCVFCAENSFATKCYHRFDVPMSCALNQAKVPLNNFDKANTEDSILQCIRKSNLRFMHTRPRSPVMPTGWAPEAVRLSWIDRRLNGTARSPFERQLIRDAMNTSVQMW